MTRQVGEVAGRHAPGQPDLIIDPPPLLLIEEIPMDQRPEQASLEGRRRRVESFGSMLGKLPARELAQLARGVRVLERVLEE